MQNKCFFSKQTECLSIQNTLLFLQNKFHSFQNKCLFLKQTPLFKTTVFFSLVSIRYDVPKVSVLYLKSYMTCPKSLTLPSWKNLYFRPQLQLRLRQCRNCEPGGRMDTCSPPPPYQRNGVVWEVWGKESDLFGLTVTPPNYVCGWNYL